MSSNYKTARDDTLHLVTTNVREYTNDEGDKLYSIYSGGMRVALFDPEDVSPGIRHVVFTEYGSNVRTNESKNESYLNPFIRNAMIIHPRDSHLLNDLCPTKGWSPSIMKGHLPTPDQEDPTPSPEDGEDETGF